MERKIDRLDKYMKASDLNDHKIAAKTGLTNGVIGKSRKEGRDLSAPALEQILKSYPEINAEWLIMGRGDMIKGEFIQQIGSIKGNNAVVGNVKGSVTTGSSEKEKALEIEVQRLKEENQQLLNRVLKLTDRLIEKLN